jgi:SAM-dependent methyltransferase
MTSQEEKPATRHSYVIDPENVAEMARLIKQDQLFTRAMGGPLAGLTTEQLAHLNQILDIGCGPGGWAMDIAAAYPDKQITGIDISTNMIAYARMLAQEKQYANATFLEMNALEPFDFPDASFDLINARTILGFVKRPDWRPFIQACSRTLRTGGILRLTEADDWSSTTSPALDHIFDLCGRAFRLANYGFSPTGRTFGIAPMLIRFLREAGYQHIKKQAYIIDFSAGTTEHDEWYHNYRVTLQLLKPLITRLGGISEGEYKLLYDQAMEEMEQSDFYGVLFFVTISGEKQ